MGPGFRQGCDPLNHPLPHSTVTLFARLRVKPISDERQFEPQINFMFVLGPIIQDRYFFDY